MAGDTLPDGGKADSSGAIQSVRRAVRLLREISHADGGLTLSDLARESELAVSTAHRILTTLECDGFVRSSGRIWYVGAEAYRVGAAFLGSDSLSATVAPAMKRLRSISHETANFGILRNNEIITISQLEGREIVRAVAPAGGRTPALNSGMGKAILAQWDREDVSSHISRYGLRRITSQSLCSEEKISTEMKQIQNCGFAVDNEEFQIGVRCIAAPILGHFGEPVGAISISGAAHRLNDDRTRLLGPMVREVANTVSSLLCGSPPRKTCG